MTGAPDSGGPGGERRLFVYAAGLARPGPVRDILAAAGWQLRLGLPRPGDAVGVWGRSPYARRGEAVAARRGAPLVRIEDAFLRSVRPGRAGGGGPLGLLIDEKGVHFDASAPSALETLLARHPLDDHGLLSRARDGIGRIAAADLSKYNHHDPDLAPPPPGYVLVVDQTRGDASIRWGGATESTFREMLVFAQEEHPGARIVIKTHPETALGHRPGHYGPEHTNMRISLCTEAISPRRLIEGAVAVYTVSSQIGFEAILMGHRPRVFGQPFYAGWGLSDDERPVARRQRVLTRTQMFAAAMILAPVWFDPCRGRRCSFEEALNQLEADVRAFREDRHGHVALGMRLWKRAHLQRFYGGERRLRFADDPVRALRTARSEGRNLLVWAGKEVPGLATPAVVLARVEDGFLRSRGLGAALVPPLSLVADRHGIYYDPSRENDLEKLIARPAPPGGIERARRLIERMKRDRLTKYNLSTSTLPELPQGHRILVPGQVEDDASIRLGAGAERTNRALLARVRLENPDAVVVYKPHPDVEAGLRDGAVSERDLARLADAVASHADPDALIAACDEVWTMTSLLGFEALLRDKPVTCLGAPFYAGWGLTRDLGPVPPRRQARPELEALVHAALIGYPRYRDPVSGRPCPPEVVAERLAQGIGQRRGPGLRLLAKAQGLLAGFGPFWR